jgi:hypothetical protein
MLEELQRRNYSPSTIRGYLQAVEQFAKHFGKSPDKLGPDDLRSYQAYLLTERKLAVGSVVGRVAALRFFFVRTLKQREFREEQILSRWLDVRFLDPNELPYDSGEGEGTPPLRFPVYECLYLINIHSQKLVDLLGELSKRFCVEHDSVAYYQSLIQCVRAGASQDIVSFMNDVEVTEEWLYERLRISEEKKFRDPEDAYLEVRRQEAEREEKGLPPRIQFLGEAQSDEEA